MGAKDKVVVEEKAQKLIGMTRAFCDEYLDGDYGSLCEKLIRKMSRKRSVPFIYGQVNIWAAAVIHAIGSINFLFDQSFEPYVSATDISDHFDASASTVSQKAKVIRDMFKMQYYDREFSTAKMNDSSPYSNLVMVNGLIVDKRTLPAELQEIVRSKQEN